MFLVLVLPQLGGLARSFLPCDPLDLAETKNKTKTKNKDYISGHRLGFKILCA